MTVEQAQHNFWSGFGVPAYRSTSVIDPVTNDAPVLPYIVYEASSGFWLDTSNITVRCWFHTNSEAVPDALAEQIGQAIGLGGINLPCDGGYIHVSRGTPWVYPGSGQDDKELKVRNLNVTLTFFTTR